MVLITAGGHKRKKKSWLGIKLRTIVTVSIGLAVLALFSTESIYYHAAQRSFEKTNAVRPSHSTSTRYGFVGREALRTSVLHEMDFLTENGQHPIQTHVVSHPRVVLLDTDDKFSLIPSRSTLPRKQTNRQVPSLGKPCCEQEPDYYINDFERPFLEDCRPIIETSVHPTCNALHELSLHSDISLLSTKGSWRTVWNVEKHKVVLKMLHLKRRFDHQSLELHALDAVAMDRLTASPHVVNAHGFCGQSVLTELAPTGGRDYVKQDEIRSRARLKIARDLAQGLADLQSLRHLSDYNSRHSPVPVFAHNDINIANTVQVDGRVKWNDFNIGVLLRTQKKNATLSCGSPVRFKGDMWRSPEEIRNTSYVRLEQSDMYGFGNILYQVMTRHQPWTHKEPGGHLTAQDVAERKRQGVLPTIPEQYKNTTKPELQTLLFATMSCYHPNPEKRLTAYELAHALGKVYERLKQKKKIAPIMIRDLFVKQ